MEDEQKLSVEDVVAPPGYEEFVANEKGIKIVPVPHWRGVQTPVHQPEAYLFAKWFAMNRPEVNVSIVDAPVVALRSNDFWLPVVFLAHDISIDLYVSLVSKYIYERAKGALKHDKTTAHCELFVEVGKDVKRISYSGPVEGLNQIPKECTRILRG